MNIVLYNWNFRVMVFLFFPSNFTKLSFCLILSLCFVDYVGCFLAAYWLR